MRREYGSFSSELDYRYLSICKREINDYCVYKRDRRVQSMASVRQAKSIFIYNYRNDRIREIEQPIDGRKHVR